MLYKNETPATLLLPLIISPCIDSYYFGIDLYQADFIYSVTSSYE